jgi:hypothetical protein
VVGQVKLKTLFRLRCSRFKGLGVKVQRFKVQRFKVQRFKVQRFKVQR